MTSLPSTKAPSPPLTDDAALRVMTFNVRYGTAPDGDDAWVHRCTLVRALLARRAPHVVGLQEALAFQNDWLAAELPHYGLVGEGRLGGSEGEHVPILVDRRRLRVQRHGTFWLSEQPQRRASRGWDAELPRICTWVALQDRRTAATAVVLNSHFDHRGVEARNESATLVATTAERLNAGPALVLGDLNAAPGSRPLRLLHEAGLRDAFAERCPDREDDGTFHAFRGAQRGLRIDYLLVADAWRVLRVEIDRFELDGRYPSDHFPVWADLELAR